MFGIFCAVNTRIVAMAVIALSPSLAAKPAFAGQALEINLSSPALDRWNYPFANDPGGSAYASVFAALASTGFDPQFDNRDGQMVIGFDTATAGIPANLSPWSYAINSATLTMTVESDQTFRYDPTPDPFQIWLPLGDPSAIPDEDLGHAVEVFGTGFRFGHTAQTYAENAPFSPLGSLGKGIRTAYPLSFEAGQCVDVSNNVDEFLDPMPFGVGLNAKLTPGQLVPANTELNFEIDVDNADVQRYLRQSLDQGVLSLTIASIFPAEQQQTGTYPRFYTKENLAVLLGLVHAAQLHLVVEISDAPGPTGDINGSGAVDVDDLLAVINGWGSCPCCSADVNFDGVVDVDDLLAVINDWG